MDTDTPAPRHTRLEGIAEYGSAIETVISRARRRIRIFDRNLESLGFNTPGRQDLLRAFLLERPANHVYIVVHDTGYLTRGCPRMLLLLRQFSHGVSIHQTHAHVRGVCDPFVIADSEHFVHRFHVDDSRSLLALDDPRQTRNLNDRFDELWEASDPAVFATTLGL
ncbi:MAG TPA: hypothetical protein VFP70_15160 [Burkholderiales bacterium]|nr:hypothetical protein [Burkholderiales bacterium]